MKKRLILIVMLGLTFLAGAHPVRADGVPGAVYVDTNNTGSEDGTQSHPYNTLKEGRAFAQALPGGAWIYQKQADGSWSRIEYDPPATPGTTGIPLPKVALYSLLAVLAVGLMLSGWLLQRKSQKNQGR